MKKPAWRIGRTPYGAWLGALLIVAVQLRSPTGVIVVYALAALLTALRFRALEWKMSRAFLPLAIALAGTLLGGLLGHRFTAFAHDVAFVAQLFISVRAGTAFGPGDPVSQKQALARSMFAQRRLVLKVSKELKAHAAILRRETAVLSEIIAHRKAYTAAHGHGPSTELEALDRRLAAQSAVVKPLRERGSSLTAHLQARTAALRSATQEWQDRNKREAA